jgi:hypothetical protein
MLVVASFVYADDVMFNYQGRVKVQGSTFDGTGYFKFAIVNNAGNITLWSNDGTSAGGSEPTGSVTVTVNEGIFNVMIGDPSLGMVAVNSSIFNIGTSSKLKLRIWFSDGVHGFQHLTPDKHIVNPQLIGITSSTTDYTIYVNGTTGDDENSGLSPTEAKLTIQAAVDALPPISKCNVDIRIAPGIYREYVSIVNKHTSHNRDINIIGDETWTPASPGDPTVRITGKDYDTTGTRVRDYAMSVTNSTSINVIGLLFDYGTKAGLAMVNGGRYEIHNCKAAHSVTGIRLGNHSNTHIYDSVAEYNDGNGIWVYSQGILSVYDSKAYHNPSNGLAIEHHSTAVLTGACDFSNNGRGVAVYRKSTAEFLATYAGQITNNSMYGIEIRFDSYTMRHWLNTFSGNGSNIFRNSGLDGGETY